MSQATADQVQAYATWMSTNGRPEDLPATVDGFRAQFPDSLLTWPDIAMATREADPRGHLQRCLLFRLREQDERRQAAAGEQRARGAMADARRDFLATSREVMRTGERHLAVALGRAIETTLERRTGIVAEADYRREVERMAGGGLRPATIGSDGRWTGEGPDALDLQFHLDRRRDKPVWDAADLLVKEGGVFTYSAAGELRRDHALKLVGSDTVLLSRVLRYRGGNRRNESKGVFNEEGWRRGVSQLLTGHSDGLNTRSRVQLGSVLVPWCAQAMRQRLAAYGSRRWVTRGLGDAEELTADLVDFTRGYLPGLVLPPHELVGMAATPSVCRQGDWIARAGAAAERLIRRPVVQTMEGCG